MDCFQQPQTQLRSDAEAVGNYVLSAGMAQVRNSILIKPRVEIRGRSGKASSKSHNHDSSELRVISFVRVGWKHHHYDNGFHADTWVAAFRSGATAPFSGGMVVSDSAIFVGTWVSLVAGGIVVAVFIEWRRTRKWKGKSRRSLHSYNHPNRIADRPSKHFQSPHPFRN